MTLSLKTLMTTLILSCCAAFMFGCIHEKNSPQPLQPSITPTIASDLAPYQQRPIEDEVFYFVLPDRFSNGDTRNDNGAKEIPISFGGFNPSDEKYFHGGDLAGLTNKLPYLEQLGITSIWLTPILRNQAVQGDIAGYHGYWVLDFTEIDPHLGSNDDLKALIDAAHKRNIKIFFDIITNHTADVIKYKECHGQDGSGWSESGEACPYISLAKLAQGKGYQTVIQKGNEQLKTPTWLNHPKHYHNQGDSTFSGENSLNGDFFGLDDLNTESQAVVDGMIEIYQHIISEFKPDGFRIDTVKHVNIEFWQQFIPALADHAKAQGIENFFMFGEVYSGNPAELSKYTTQGTLPSVLDFGLQSVLYQTLIEQKPTALFSTLFAQDGLYKNANQLLNFTGNHDMGRFAYLLAKQEKFSHQEISQRLKLASAMTFFLRGVPVIYYGDEQGFIGTGDNHNARQDMMPSKVATHNAQKLLETTASTAQDNFDISHPLFTYFAKLAALYHQHETLRVGEQEVILTQNKAGLLILRKQDKQDDYLIAFNTAIAEQSALLTLDKQYQLIHPSEQALIETVGEQSRISLPGLSFALYRAVK
ncbi:alpha-amylase family glycosyl hydrolase [Thalassotalea sp. 1_MG-2023]|uniref:alpha-amylase family glycosyl hydrolase n=1 Tax=Thalassotalea sp. 1_MG-2023 TaxID=3062680 RepID=UPI0026E38D2F|nr:alpha-amylase family glycosyl hydrolase [Thalassotalea sp. 1_MG-2023]MDO6427127.1 alpha-amylase family glycosyl hydrolase [Thalassotalea sp. 1_MG-2023]